MKVVLFCGGLGLRLRDHPDGLPKPMVTIGYRPILWHLMKYYAHFGHRDFILCLGYKADVIKDYFLNYSEALSNDFVFSNGGTDLELLSSDIHDWKITFVDTGVNATIGERLRRVRPHLVGEDVFLANYADGLSDLDLDMYIENALATGKIASFVAVRPSLSLHSVAADETGEVTSINAFTETDLWINGGFFVLRQEIFDYMRPGEELVSEPFHRLIAERQLNTLKYDNGFWQAMDTFKDRMLLEDLYSSGSPPWQLWDREGAPATPVVDGSSNVASARPADD